MRTMTETFIDDRRPMPEGEFPAAVHEKVNGEGQDAEVERERARHDVDGGFPPAKGEGCRDCHPPACWRCAHYPCETYATELPCPGGYVPVTMQTEESDLLLMEVVRRRRAQILAEVGEEATTKVMTPLNPRWDEFEGMLDAAIRAEGCDASSLRLSERLLLGMAGIDVPKSVEFFRANGGYCDCEVLPNVGA